MNRSITRRSLLAGTAATLAANSVPTPARADQHAKPKGISLKKGATVLLQGDSITDAGRDKRRQEQANDFAMLGRGYAKMIAYHLLSKHSEKNLKIYNRGISGHKVPDLDKRWQKDTIDLKPDILSILIGVNDIWHKMNGRYDGTVATYQAGLESLLKRTKSALPDVQIVICEPFALRCGAVKDSWFPEFDQRRAGAKAAAKSAGVLFVPFQDMFDDAVKAGSEPKHWAGDGVHPSAQGQSLMASRWLGDTGLA